MRKLIVIFVFSLITGCVSLGNIHDPSLVSIDQLSEEDGVLILSAGASESCLSTSTFLKVHKSSEDYFSEELALLGVDSASLKSDFSDHQGNLHALALPAGTYYLAAWIANPYVEPLKVPKAEFEIRKGEMVYLGEYFMDVSCVWNPIANFNNRYERDIQLLTEKNPDMVGRQINTRIAKITGYAVDKE